MPFATAPDGVRIHYEVEGDGPPLVLQHGLLSSLESWRERGYVERLRPHHQLILVDSRGHGLSDKPEEQAAYDLRTRVVDIAAVLNDAGVGRAHYLGYSMGCWIGYGALIYMPQRFQSVIGGGFSPYRGPAMPFSELHNSPAVRSHAGRRETLEQHPRAIECALGELRRWRGVVQAMRTTEVPVLLFAGTEDPNEAARDMPTVAADARDATFFAVEGADHTGAADAVDVVAPRVLEFLARVEAAAPAEDRSAGGG